MNFGSICSGIEAASMAWNPLGWRTQFVSEIDRFPCELLKVRHPDVPNFGDMTQFHEWPDANLDVLVGGTPCQSFSVAGLRKGLDDPRGNLMLTYLAIAARYQPEWLVWENVPGVLSSGEGRDFGSLLGGLAELGYGFYGSAPIADNLISHALLAKPNDAHDASMQTYVAHTLNANSGRNQIEANYVTHALTAEGFDASEDGTGRGTPLTVAFNARQDPDSWVERTGPIDTDGTSQAIAFVQNSRSEVRYMPITGALCGEPGAQQQSYVKAGMAVRRLTPRECERLQGFPDDYTLITYKRKPATDGVRYKGLGNSMAVPVMRWIGQRIELARELARPAIAQKPDAKEVA